MKKIKFDRNYLRASVYVFFTVAALIIFEKVFANLAQLSGAIGAFFRISSGILAPFLAGIVIAYFLNGAVMFFERLWKKIKPLGRRKRAVRVISVFTVYIILIGVIAWVIAFLVPEIGGSLVSLVSEITTAVKNFDLNDIPLDINWDGTFQEFLDTVNKTFSTNFTAEGLLDSALKPVLAVLSSLPNFVVTLLQQTFNFAHGLFNFIVGLIIAFYMLCEKDNVSSFFAKLTRVIFNRARADVIIDFAKSASKIFSNFVIGQGLDSVLIGLIFFAAASILKFPYPPLLALIIGSTNMIPFFGPFLGATPVIFIVLLDNPINALWCAITILIMQQIDGNIIAPRIVGESTGIKPMGVIFAILVGGALFGIAGMFFGVPVFAVLSHAVTTYVDAQYAKTRERDKEEDDNKQNEGSAWL